MVNQRLREKNTESRSTDDSFQKPAGKGRREGEGSRQAE